MTDETFAKTCERLETVATRRTNDPLVGLQSRSLEAARTVLAIQGIEEPTYEQLAAAIDLGAPSLRGVQR